MPGKGERVVTARAQARAKRTPTKAQLLRTRLGLAAKADPTRRFHALYDKMYRPDILQLAWTSVRANHGAAGVDRESIEEIEAHGVEAFLNQLQTELQEGTYRPMPVRRVYIPKASGGRRPLGIASVRDRVVQTAVKLVLEPIFEADFLDCSYGFRPSRGAHDALNAIRVTVHQGTYFVVDADIRQFFDSIEHDLLIRAVARRVSDPKVLRLVRRFVAAGIMEDGKVRSASVGTPQGGPLSPLLANAVLHGLDVMWGRKGAEYGTLVRYADDAVVLCKTRRDAERALARLHEILGKLRLEINEEKTHLVDLRWGREGFTFLGFYHRMRRMYRRRITALLRWPAPRACKALRERVRTLTARDQVGKDEKTVVEAVNRTVRGWGNYFTKGNSSRVFGSMDHYVQLRLTIWENRKFKRRSHSWGPQATAEHFRQIGVYRLSGKAQRSGRMPEATSR